MGETFYTSCKAILFATIKGETLGEICILLAVYPSISATKFLNKMVEIKGRNRRETHFLFGNSSYEFFYHVMIDELFFPTFTNTNPALENESGCVFKF